VLAMIRAVWDWFVSTNMKCWACLMNFYLNFLIVLCNIAITNITTVSWLSRQKRYSQFALNEKKTLQIAAPFIVLSWSLQSFKYKIIDWIQTHAKNISSSTRILESAIKRTWVLYFWTLATLNYFYTCWTRFFLISQ